MSGVTRRVGGGRGAGEAEVEGDGFSINRLAQGLVGDFLGRVLGGGAGLAVIWLINQRRWGHGARRSLLPVIYALPGGRTRAPTVRDEFTESRRAPNERVLFHTPLSFKRKINGEESAWHTTPHRHPPLPSILCHPRGVASTKDHTHDTVCVRVCDVSAVNWSIAAPVRPDWG